MEQTQKQRSRLQTLLELSIPLIAGVVVAVIWANVDEHSYHSLIHWSPFSDPHYNVHFFFNDIFMVLFFGIAAGEITEAVMPGGPLNPPSRAINPLLGTLGGVVGPIGAYFLWIAMTGDMGPQPEGITNGWGIPTATDIALAWLIARIVFGASHPAVSFLLLLAVADDAIGLGIIAVFYPDPNHPAEPIYLLLVLGAMVLAYGLRKMKVANFGWYLMLPGVLSWCGLYFAHLHPALALVVIVPFMPCMSHDEGLFAEDHSPEAHEDTLNRFQHALKAPVDIGLFGFGLANAGVAFSSVGNPTWAVLFALIVGKTVGITLFSGVGARLGFPMPDGMNLRSLFVAGIIASLGLTVALFVCGQAFPDGSTAQAAAKMGALFSALAAPIAIAVGRVLKVKQETDASVSTSSGDTELASNTAS